MKHFIHIIAKFLLVLGSVNYLSISLMKVNIFDSIKSTMITNILFFLIGICAVYFMFDRDYYLPFLGECVIPVSDGKRTDSNFTKVTLNNLPKNSNVIFWASKSDGGEDPLSAYGNYANTGIAKTDDKGNVTLEVNCPVQYKVPMFGKLQKHVHYRYEMPDYKGIFSRVYTKNIDKC